MKYNTSSNGQPKIGHETHDRYVTKSQAECMIEAGRLLREQTGSHPQAAEVKRLLIHLIASGFTLVSVDDGGETHATPTVVSALPHILGVDVSDLCVSHPALLNFVGWTNKRSIELILGNGPGELCSNYTVHSPLRECIESWADMEASR